MKVKISKGNSKIGGTMNISLPPGKTCRPDAKCFNDGCYAKNSYGMYPNVRKAWDNNLECYHKNPDEYFDSILNKVSGADFFRWHVSGDIIDQVYFEGIVEVAELTVITKFLVFTKRYDLDFTRAPENLQVVLSVWPGMPLPDNKDLPWAWLEEDTRRDQNGMYLKCPGHCEECEHKCWTLLQHDVDVVFPRHGRGRNAKV